MANIDLGNLTRYDGKIKQYAEDKYLSKNTANWQMTEKAGAVTCYPVPDTDLEPIVDFSFKEVPPASGEKSPSNPSTITGIKSIKVTRCGKNLIEPLETVATTTINGVTFTVNEDGSYTVNGTATANADFYLRYSADGLLLKGGMIYTLSGCPSGGDSGGYRIIIAGGGYAADTGSTATVSVENDVKCACYIRVYSGYTVSNLVFKPQLELGTVTTSFEPYNDEDYTIQLGDTYYSGSVNLATGMMTVTWNSIVYTGEENVTYISTTNDLYQYNLPAPSYASGYGATYFSCTHFAPAINNEETFYVRGSGGAGTRIYVSEYTTVDAVKAWLATQYANGTPVTVVYQLATPYTVQLTSQQIKSLFALDKNTPRLNTLYTDADSIQVGYQKHPARTTYELENAILALGGGE